MIEHEHELENVENQPFIQTTAQLRANDYQPINEILFQFLNYMEQDVWTRNISVRCERR